MRNENLGAAWASDAPFWLAQGVLAERLGITVEVAGRTLRAHAERTGRPLLDIAHDVVGFRLLIDPTDET